MQIVSVRVEWSEEVEFEGVKIKPSVALKATLDADDDAIAVVYNLLDDAKEHVVAALECLVSGG